MRYVDFTYAIIIFVIVKFIELFGPLLFTWRWVLVISDLILVGSHFLPRAAYFCDTGQHFLSLLHPREVVGSPNRSLLPQKFVRDSSHMILYIPLI